MALKSLNLSESISSQKLHTSLNSTDCTASYNVKTGRQSVSILLQEGLVKLIASH